MPAASETKASIGLALQLQDAAMLATAWFAVAGAGHALSPGDDVHGFFWLPAGLLLSALLLSVRVEWPALLVGALLGEAAFGLAHDLSPGAIATRFAITALQALAGAFAAERFIRRPFRIESPRDLLWFLSFAAALAPLGGALFGAFVSVGSSSLQLFERAVSARWMSSAMGVLLFAPLVLAWSFPLDSGLGLRERRRQIEVALLALCAAGTLLLVFGFARGIASPLRILLVVPVIWASLRFGLRGATAMHFALALPLAWFTGAAFARVSGFAVHDQVLPAQTLTLMLAVIGLALAMVLQESRDQFAALQRSSEEVRRLSRLYASLSAVNQAVLTEPSADSFLAATCRILVEDGGLLLAAIGRADLEEGKLDVVARAGPGSGFLDVVEFSIDDAPVGKGPAATAVTTGSPYICNDFHNDPRTIPWQAPARSFGFRSSGAFPILDASGVWGVLTLYSSELGYFGDREVQLLAEIAHNIRFALDQFTQEMSRRATEHALRESEERFRINMEYSPIGMALVATDGRWLDVNPSLCRIIGYSREEFLSSDFQSVTHPDDLAADLALVQQCLSGKIGSYRLEKRYIRKDGVTIWTQLDVVLIRMVGGSPRYFLSKVQDITLRKEAERRILELNLTLEQRVAERTRALEKANRELEIANRELEAFSSSVSHDLRSPLRLIDGFSTMLAKHHIDPEDAEGHEDLARIRKAATRMGDLIDSLLHLARLTRAPLHREDVDLSALARETAEALRAEHPGRNVVLSIEPDLVARGSVALLRAVIENLLGNAWKFTARVEKAEIEVGRELHEGRMQFFVRDNGAGFNMQYASQLFRAFHRLHDDRDFPGTGIGLATVQRIIQRHGGSVGVEGEEGEGATFYFTLPDNDADVEAEQQRIATAGS